MKYKFLKYKFAIFRFENKHGVLYDGCFMEFPELGELQNLRPRSRIQDLIENATWWLGVQVEAIYKDKMPDKVIPVLGYHDFIYDIEHDPKHNYHKLVGIINIPTVLEIKDET